MVQKYARSPFNEVMQMLRKLGLFLMFGRSALKLMNSGLESRYQCVKVKNSIFTLKESFSRVSEAAMLEPILFSTVWLDNFFSQCKTSAMC